MNVTRALSATAHMARTRLYTAITYLPIFLRVLVILEILLNPLTDVLQGAFTSQALDCPIAELGVSVLWLRWYNFGFGWQLRLDFSLLALLRIRLGSRNSIRVG